MYLMTGAHLRRLRLAATGPGFWAHDVAIQIFLPRRRALALLRQPGFLCLERSILGGRLCKLLHPDSDAAQTLLITETGCIV